MTETPAGITTPRSGGPRRRLAPVALAALLATAALVAVGHSGTRVAAAGGNTLYVTSRDSSEVIPVALPSNTVGTPFGVDALPYGIALTPDGSSAYVATAGGNGFAGSVTPFTTASNSVGTSITSNVSNPEAVAVTPDGVTAYVVNAGSDTVTPVTVATNTAGTPIPVGQFPTGIAITPDGKTAYVTNEGLATVTPIDIATNTAGTAIVVGLNPEAIAITPDGKTAYVTDRGPVVGGVGGGNTVTPIDIATNTPGVPIVVGTDPRGIAITPDGTMAYVTNSVDNTVTPITIATNTAGTAIPVGSAPIGIAITPDGTTAYTANSVSQDLTPITIATNTAGAAITIGQPNLQRIAITPSATTTTLTSSASPSTVGQSVHFTATIAPVPSGGTVQFSIDGVPFGSPVAVVNGVATSASISTLTLGTHSVLAKFSGVPFYFVSSTSAPFSQVVNAAPVTPPATIPPVPDAGAGSPGPALLLVSLGGGVVGAAALPRRRRRSGAR